MSGEFFQEPPGSGQGPHCFSFLAAEDMRAAVIWAPGIVSAGCLDGNPRAPDCVMQYKQIKCFQRWADQMHCFKQGSKQWLLSVSNGSPGQSMTP